MNSRLGKGCFLTAALLAVFMVFTIPAAAQLTSGDLVGTVLDPTGAALPHANVSAVNTDTGVEDSATPRNSGEYRLSNLSVCPYQEAGKATGLNTCAFHGN